MTPYCVAESLCVLIPYISLCVALFSPLLKQRHEVKHFVRLRKIRKIPSTVKRAYSNQALQPHRDN